MTEMNIAVNEILEGKKAPTHSAGLASLIFNWQKWNFSAPKDTFAFNQSLVLRINPDNYREGENRYLQKAAKRYSQYKLKIR